MVNQLTGKWQSEKTKLKKKQTNNTLQKCTFFKEIYIDNIYKRLPC